MLPYTPYIPPTQYYEGAIHAWDTFRDKSDRNISSKIAGQNIKIRLTSLKDNNKIPFTGAVCSRLLLKNSTSDWDITIFNNNETSKETLNGDPTFNIVKADKNVSVEMVWMPYMILNNKVFCRTIGEALTYTNFHHSFSEDNFAIKPYRYKINSPTSVKAGEDFNLSYQALDYNDKNTSGYNENNGSSFDFNITENKSICIQGNFGGDINFSDGGGTSLSNYSEVGNINLKISDDKIACNKRYAGIDCDDANVTNYWHQNDTKIKTAEKNITVVPHHFLIEYSLKNYNKKFTYLSKDLNMSSTLDINITAQNEQNITTKNYSGECYSKKTDINISYKDINNSLKYINYNSHIIDINKTIIVEYDRSNYKNGEFNKRNLINFDRKPVYPFDFNITKIKVYDEDIISENNKSQKSTFYYGRAYISNQKVIGNIKKVNVSYQYYCNKNIFRWCINTEHNKKDGNYGDVIKPLYIGIRNIDYESFYSIYDKSRGYPYIKYLKYKPSSWLVYDKYDDNATYNYFRIEYHSKNIGWCGLHETNSTTKTDASLITNYRIEW